MTRKANGKTPEKALSRAEWQVMNVCWRIGTATAKRVQEEVAGSYERDYQTIKTLLDRITRKGYLTMEKLGPLCLYTPAVERKAAVGEAVREFVDTVLERSFAPLMLQLVEEEELSDDEARELKELLERREGEEA